MMLGAAGALFSFVLFLALRDAPPARPDAGGERKEPGTRKVRVIRPSETPRSPFYLGLEAEMEGEICRILLHLRSAEGGPAEIDFRLPEGAAALEGELHRQCDLDPGMNREERIVVQVPDGAYHLIGVQASVSGSLSESFVELGDPPTATERGLRTRVRPDGSGVLRIGPEDLGQ